MNDALLSVEGREHRLEKRMVVLGVRSEDPMRNYVGGLDESCSLTVDEKRNLG